MYSGGMVRRTTIEIDDDLLHRAQEALGTRGLKDTVEAAFDEAIRMHLQMRFLERLRTGEGIDRGPEMLAQTRPRP